MRRILVVDDEHDVADSLVLFLETYGAEVRAAYGGSAALDAVETFKPEVILLDLGMPCVDGFETARRIRSTPDGSDVEIIALTAWDKESVADRACGLFDNHLVKPAQIDTLCNRLLCHAHCLQKSKPCALFPRKKDCD
jgi:CheY-like chemotaxis protein